MSIPNVPTDNIYKFSAIFGLIIFAASNYLYQAFDRNIHDAKIQRELSYNKRRTDSIFLNNTIQMFNMRMEMLNNRLKKISENNLYIEDILPENAGIKNDFLEIHKVSKEYENSIIESYKRDTDLEYSKNEQNKYKVYAITCMIFGIVLIAWGFSSWYFKHQIYIDAEVKCNGQTFRDLLKNANNNSKSKPEQTDSNDETPIGESIS
ncbi:hypothetical protein [Pseudotamlana carrageenivorans]|uniref:Uncharacterized protein n=1 Tax=Pseudotamlana carrageenivorans TaxID=2069432 RepID=A0A2I7SM82_9FLAO|nr:hypothetical protein [Tamlana carrageenivorans]AUS06992.1 hypothetical protein C1A40_16755 [Tamlana carrageenivorans]